MNKKSKRLLISCFATFFAASLASNSSAELVKGFPDALVCDVPKGKIVLYLHLVEKTGSAIFMAQGGKYVTLKKDGTVIRDGKVMQSCTKREISN
jgi:hypothetical protein